MRRRESIVERALSLEGVLAYTQGRWELFGSLWTREVECSNGSYITWTGCSDVLWGRTWTVGSRCSGS
jgi:hypothetical protein